MGALAVTLSDSDGFVHDPKGISIDKLQWVMELKNERRGRIAEYAERFPGTTFTATDAGDDHSPLWDIPAECAFPSATENEIDAKDAANLLSNGVFVVGEAREHADRARGRGAVRERRDPLRAGQGRERRRRGGLGLEMAQDSLRLKWPREEVDARLKDIMKAIHQQCRETAEEYDVPGNYVHGANIAGFTKVADAMLDQGLV